MRAERSADVVVVGAGPAGLTAARCAAEGGAEVLVLDASPGPGGQIWRGLREEQPGHAAALLREVRGLGVQILSQAQVSFAEPLNGSRHTLVVSTPENLCWVRANTVILATGATERFLPFPGWTLPGVVGAGGLQAMTKCGLDVRGQRVVVAGSGPLLLAVAASLQERAARVVAVAEQARWSGLIRFGLSASRLPGKSAEALKLAASLRGVPYWPGTYPLRASGNSRLEAVTLRRAGRDLTLACDWLAAGFGLVPDTRVAQLLGCALNRTGAVQVSAWQQTSRPGIYAAGEVTGVGGVDKALLEGFVAGCAATGQVRRLGDVAGQVERQRAFQAALEQSFALRPELRDLPGPDTVVCRCEDVRQRDLQGCTSWADAKLQTRCGMGACQGRVCGPATTTLHGWTVTGLRPPLTPVPISELLQAAEPRAQPHTDPPRPLRGPPSPAPIPLFKEETA
ncbi:putative FAD-dependent pyridine nucleotide-disulfide oxidoreductase (plasmid) [Deinococcus deserti VCD115]|uniref:Putative FAD-dependent pyridine nucleotide-disulfide oxidoreductase n=1 Tax=Deinococcus deserti (strain DSM 17065 / CIP 109153 / LMG 22923 / VCD115) TaxID=546414 RepID=C1D1Y9_DEIDV|nr:FAD-dependent oxidoreductase [Deinococcus deserti]ACO47428.1 putative FAD-dependent pyridine nucleotide-disulfide oxidoreductase [Deinococcus deserti VCD115]